MMYRIRTMRRTTKNPPIVNPAISLIIHINAATKKRMETMQLQE